MNVFASEIPESKSRGLKSTWNDVIEELSQTTNQTQAFMESQPRFSPPLSDI